MLKKRQRFRKKERFFLRDGVCLLLERLLGAIKNRETKLSVGSSSGRMLAEVLREEALRSFAACMKEGSPFRQAMCVTGIFG